MDNIVYLIIAGIVFALNTLLNNNKEKQKNADRNIQIPKKTVTQPRAQMPPSPTPTRKKIIETQSLPNIPKENSLNTTEKRNSIDSETMRQIEKYKSDDDIYDTVDTHDDLLSLSEDDEIGNEHKKVNKSLSIGLETKEDFKKAIIYSTILERKY